MSGEEDKATSSSIPPSIHPTESTMRYLWWIFHGLTDFLSGMDALFPVFIGTKQNDLWKIKHLWYGEVLVLFYLKALLSSSPVNGNDDYSICPLIERTVREISWYLKLDHLLFVVCCCSTITREKNKKINKIKKQQKKQQIPIYLKQL